MVAILKAWRQIENPIPSVEAYLLEEDSAKFHPDPISGVWIRRPNNKKKNKISSDIRSVTDLIQRVRMYYGRDQVL